jgi:DNA-binding Xre family transcriptional regulator
MPMPDAVPPEGMIVCTLSQLMNERQLSTIQVARLANLSRPTVRKLRDNRADRVSMTTISKLCSSLQVGVGVLFRHIPQHALIGIIDDYHEDQTLMGADES